VRIEPYETLLGVSKIFDDALSRKVQFRGKVLQLCNIALSSNSLMVTESGWEDFYG
jgi:hypothetical protein